jgi:hypothetical protein
MVAAFAGEFFWKSVRDFRAWIGLVGLVAAGIGGAIGKPIILPTWVWLLIAFASAISMAIRAEWKAYRDAEAQIEPDMKLVDVVKRIVGSDDVLVGENCSKTGTALQMIRERGHLGQIDVWGRRNVLAEDMDLYPRTSIPAPYWYAFDIDYLKFLDDQRGESKPVRIIRNQPHRLRPSGRRMLSTAIFGFQPTRSKRIGRSRSDGSNCNGRLESMSSPSTSKARRPATSSPTRLR